MGESVELYLEGSVGEVMTPDPVCVREDDDLESLVKLFQERKYQGFPVLDHRGRLVGLVRDSDLVSIFARRDPASRRYKKVGDIMQSPPPTVGPDMSVQKAIMKSFSDQSRLLVVTDREGKVVGVVTRIDLVKGIRFRPVND